MNKPDCIWVGPHPSLLFSDEESSIEHGVLELIARVIGWFEPLSDRGPGHLPAETGRVLEAIAGADLSERWSAKLT